MSAQPSPGYARNSDSSANSSPLLPFNNKTLPADNGFADEDGWGATGGYDEGSPQYGNSSHALNQDRERQDDGMTGQDGREHGRQEYGQQSEAGPSRKRPRLEDGYSNPHSHTNSHNGTPQPQNPHQNQHQQHQHPQQAHAQAHRANPHDGYGDFAIPFPHQMPLPDRSKEIYLLGVQDPDLRNRSPYQPVPRIIMHSILGFTPRNEVSREIGEWLLVTCGHLPGNVEVSFGSPGSTVHLWVGLRVESDGRFATLTILRPVSSGDSRSRSSSGISQQKDRRIDYDYQSRPKFVSLVLIITLIHLRG
jgi:hypothetical protein